MAATTEYLRMRAVEIAGKISFMVMVVVCERICADSRMLVCHFAKRMKS